MAIKIGLDCGHGLRTAGKQTPDGIKEWTLNDKVRDKVAELLKDFDVEIVHTDNNEGNTDESLASRLQKYLNAGVKAFVSIHHNAFTGTWNSATGVEVFTDKNPTSDDKKLANCIYDRLVKYTGLKGRGIQQEDWYVINQDRIPAVLVEGGFMDGTEDYKVITSATGQNAYARAVAEGLIEFLGLEKKVKPSSGSSSDDSSLYRVQVGAFSKRENGEAMLAKVKKAGFEAIMIQIGRYYKIQVGAFSVKKNAENQLAKVKVAGFEGFVTQQVGAVVATSEYYPKYTGNSYGIDTVFKAIGVPSIYLGSAKDRKPIAIANGFGNNYKGSEKDNLALISLAKQGKLKRP